ncbi:MAG: adenylyl-sulfate kinase [Pseudomonadota bacterium]
MPVNEKSSNVSWQRGTVERKHRELLNGHAGAVLWFTGLSGAGKSTLAHAVEAKLHAMGVRTYVLDGDNVRHGLCGDLGFSAADRSENIRRIGEVSKLFADAGVMVLAAFISPFRADRDKVRGLVRQGDFVEIHCKCSVEVCEARDVKGLYKLARAGGVKEFTGISSPYEEPLSPELSIDTAELSLEQCVSEVLSSLRKLGMLQENP